MERTKKRISESQLESVHIVHMSHLNSVGRLFGGILLQWIDETAALVAKRHARMGVTTASIDHLQFLHGAYPGDTIVLTAKMTYVGRTSMDVKVETYAEKISGERILINCAYITEVAIGEDGKPAEVPGLILETEEEHTEWEKGEKRRNNRRRHGEENE